MNYSYTQIAHYLRCPRSYRHRYLDGWREKETRAAMLFGRCFERALESYFCGGDCSAALHREWGAFRDTHFEYKKGDTWDRLVHQGVHLLQRFAQDNRIRIPQPQENLQLKVVRELPDANQFVAYIDAIGELDGNRCLLDWKTTTSRYPDEPAGLLTLDPQLICYSWMTAFGHRDRAQDARSSCSRFVVSGSHCGQGTGRPRSGRWWLQRGGQIPGVGVPRSRF